MLSVDFRNATFEGLKDSLTELRRRALEGWQRAGPGTTRHVATRCGMDILTFRPRSTELLEMGLIKVVGHCRDGQKTEGLYEARTAEEWEAWRRQQMGEPIITQQTLI